MPEVTRGNNLDDIKNVLKYFKAEHILKDLDLQPGTNMVNIKKKGDQNEGITYLLNTTLKNSTKYNIFLGCNPEQRAVVRQWIDYLCHNVIQNRFQSHKILAELDAALARTTFFAGHSLTVCDALFYNSLYPTFEIMSFEEKEKYRNLSRWFSLIQEDQDLRQGNRKIRFMKTPLYTVNL